MSDMSLVKAGIAWAMPVRPDLLIDRLGDYERSLPVLHTLRLCHRFGKGPQVNITKLPNEILLSIEEDICEHDRCPFFNWPGPFAHFESQCEPLDHHGDSEEALYKIRCDLFEYLCEECQADNEWAECNGEECEPMLRRRLNELMATDLDWRYDCCEDQRAEWLRLIDQNPGKHFARYDEVSNMRIYIW